jgi:hypothetical protein
MFRMKAALVTSNVAHLVAMTRRPPAPEKEP